MSPIVSILIPAYNPRYLPAALDSALAQPYPDAEIVVVDDSCTGDIAAIAASRANPRLKYVRNDRNLGFSKNFTRCAELATGDFLKFLNDDDVLHPDCVARLMEAFAWGGERVALAVVRRQVIDGNGQAMPDLPATKPIAAVDATMRGRQIGNLLMAATMNLLGEPSAALFRRRDLQIEDGDIFRFAGHDYHCLADLSLWLRLLAGGDLAYVAQPLCAYRVHPEQEQRKPEVGQKCLSERVTIIGDARRLGFLAEVGQLEQTLATTGKRLAEIAAAGMLPAADHARLQAELANIRETWLPSGSAGGRNP